MLSNNWFEGKVSIDKNVGDGKIKKQTEAYLIDAMTFGSAEERLIEETAPYCSGELDVKELRHANYAEVIPSELDSDDKWYKLKYNIITIDEKTGAEKTTPVYVLIQAANVVVAQEYFKESMRGTMVDYRIAAIQETKILDVFTMKTHED